jgi:AcrR family transcriptional regulator
MMSAAEISYDISVARWEPNARERLMDAAMALFVERGYAETTVEDIAERAGLTERTFFRHFTDKREVLFSGSSRLQDVIVDAIGRAPAATAPFELVMSSLEATEQFFAEERRAWSRQRQSLIVASVELRERELIKLAMLASAIAECLRRRGVAEPTASLTAEAGIAIFKIGFERWIGETARRGFASYLHAARAAFDAATRPKPKPKRRAKLSRSGR